jgi:aryl carrier-like protein
VKIAGQRLEPAEVAAVLRKHHKVTSAAVVPIHLQGETSLVACLVLAPPDLAWTRELANELREHCAKSLPSFAIPSYWLITDILPTTGSGKIDNVSLKKRLEGLDRQALIRLSLLDPGTAVDGGSPSEQTLREIWASVLELEIAMIDSSNSFLALGGSSIRAIQVVSACRQKGWDISVADVIRAKSLKDLAGLVETTSFALSVPQYQPFSLLDTDVSLMDEEFKDFDDVYPASPLQEALVAASLAGSTDYLYQRVYSIQGIDFLRMKDAMQSVFSKDAVVRTTFISGRSGLLQAVLRCELPFEERHEPLEEYKLLDAARGVVLGQPFCRVAILPKDSLLVLTMHHSLFDYWSNNFFLDDSAAVYLGGSPISRPSFTSFIHHIVNTDGEASRSFWREYLRDASPTKLTLRPYQQHVVERELSLSVNQFLSSYSVTSGALVYAAWALVLAAHMASNEVTFGTTLSGRDVPISEVHAMNGPTLTSVPQRIFVDGNQVALDFVRAVQDSFWEMNRFSQFGMRNALRVAGHSNDLFDSLVNLLVDKEIPSLTQKIFQPHGAKPVWSTEFISLEVIHSGDKFLVNLTSHLEPLRSKFILDQFVNALAGIVASPHASLSAIELVGEAEHKHLMEMSPPVAPSVTHLMHEPCERHAAMTPHRIAVQFECSEYVSYKQLNSRANRLAAILRSKGVGPEVIVPFCLDKYVLPI